jgi:hypothetical protein
MSNDTKILQTKTTVKVVCVLIYLAGITLLSIHLPFNIPEYHKAYIVPCYVVAGLLWLADVFFTRIELRPDTIKIVSIAPFTSRVIPRPQIDSVTWEKGCGASLKLTDGKWVKLPDVTGNAQGLTNTIRAWLKRTMP